jgi:hypothetical protein
MLSKISKIGLSLVLGVSLSYASKSDDVKAFVQKGAELCDTKGTVECLKEFNNPNGAFIKGELYMFAYNFSGVNKALGSNPKMVGKNLYKLKDASGSMLIQELINIAKVKEEGWFDYKWSHPQTKKITAKTSYIKRINDNLFIGTGYYK